MPVSILLSAILVAAQEQPRATLIDEFGFIHCDEMLARIDNFYIQLNSNPTAKGLVVISGSNDHLVKKLQLEILFTSGVIQRRRETSRVAVIRGKETGEAKMQFWLLPAGAKEPEKAVATWNLTIPEGTKPFYFHSDSDSICFYPTVYKHLKELLAANPKLRINAVVWEQNSRKFRKEVRSIREILVTDKTRRLRFFQKREFAFESATEFWLLP